MENKKFAKLFEFDNKQVLITIEDGHEGDNGFMVVQTTNFDIVRPTLSVGFDNENDRDKYFKEYNTKNAKKFFKIVYNMLI